MSRLAVLLAVLACASPGPKSVPPAPPPAAAAAPVEPAAATPPILAPDPAPETPARTVTETFHGVTVEDPYRWLEDNASPEVQAWTAAQDRRARRFLAALPEHDALTRQVQALLTAKVTRWPEVEWRPGRL